MRIERIAAIVAFIFSREEQAEIRRNNRRIVRRRTGEVFA